MANRSALLALVHGVQARFAGDPRVVVTACGWKQRFERVNQGTPGANRIVFIPGDENGRSGPLKKPRLVQTNPRPLAEWDQLVTMSVWAVDETDTANDELQIAAAEALLERAVEAVHLALEPETGTPAGVANVIWGDVTWNVGNRELAFGRELLVTFVLRTALFATPYDTATPRPLITKTFTQPQAPADDEDDMPTAANLAQTEWHFDSVNGRDTNDGLTPSTALQTVAEYVRRVGLDRRIAPGQKVDLYWHAPMLASDRQSLRVTVDDATSAFRMHFPLTQIATGNLSSFTATDEPTNRQARVTAAGLSSANIGQHLYFPNLDAWCTIVRDEGGGVLTVTDPQKFGATAMTDMTRATVGNAELYQVFDGTAAYFGAIECRNAWPGGSAVWPPPFLIEGAKFPDKVTIGGLGAYFQRTLIQRCQFQKGVYTLEGSSPYFRTCDFNFDGSDGGSNFASNIETQVLFSNCALRGTVGGVPQMIGASFGVDEQDGNVISCGGVLFFEFAGVGHGRLCNLTSGLGLQMLQGFFSIAHDVTSIYGVSGATYALTLGRGSQCVYDAAATIYSTGSVGQIHAGGLAGPTSLKPAPDQAAAPCTTWAQLRAAPFNGVAWDYASMCGFVPDNI